MIKLNSNIVNISLLKCVIDELPYDPFNNDELRNKKLLDIKETIKEVIESLENKG
tara:strand:- start:190 stop:354 length:165 start_codon:yes stop_codon:yes gene_type:complete